jgi:hypothetical protein
MGDSLAILEGKVRVYSFAFSGAPLSQYLAWAKHAVEFYHADALAIFVMSNDFDESIQRFAVKPGFYQYTKVDDASDWVWVRNDYAPNELIDIVNASSLLQYLYRNVRITTSAEALKKTLGGAFAALLGKKEARAKNANPGDQVKLVESQQIVDIFLRDIVTKTGLPADHILFVVDGLRGRIYKGLPRDGSEDYGAKMLSYFVAAAREHGFEVIDMHGIFAADFANNHRSFQFPTDGHWNSYAHSIVEKAVADSDVLRNLAAPSLSGNR